MVRGRSESFFASAREQLVIRTTCSSIRNSDGTFSLTPERKASAKGQAVELRGPWAAVWESTSRLAELLASEQRAIVRSMPYAERARLVRGLALFRRAGLLAFRRENERSERDASTPPSLHKLHLEVTYGCNFRCQGCYLGPRLSPPSQARAVEAGTDRWLRLIREAGELGCSFATVTGGEPFLRDDLFEILEALTEEGIVAEVNTNASAISDRIAEGLRSFLISAVAVTVYGYDEESARAYTGNRTSLEATVRGITHLAARQVPVVVKYFATRDTQQGYDRMAERLGALGVPVAQVGSIIHGDVFEGRSRGHLVGDWEKPEIVQRDPLPCFPAGTVLNIEPDGRVRPCPKVSVDLGNAFDEGLAEVWARARRPWAFRRFWLEYCREEGFVSGSSHSVLCPGSVMLSAPEGLSSFRQRWALFTQEDRHV